MGAGVSGLEEHQEHDQAEEDRARAIRIEEKLDRVITFCELVETMAGPWMSAGKGRLMMAMLAAKGRS